MDILVVRNEIRKLVMQQKKITGGLVSVKRLLYKDIIAIDTRMNAMRLAGLNRAIKKAKLTRKKDGPEIQVIGVAVGFNYISVLKSSRLAMKRLNEIVPDKVLVQWKYNKNHRLFKKKLVHFNSNVIQQSDLKLNMPDHFVKTSSHLISNYREWYYNDVVSMRKNSAGTYLTRAREEAMQNLGTESLRPSSSDKSSYIGIEIECASAMNVTDMIEHIAHTKLSLAKYVRVGSDGSIRTEEKFPHPIEFRLMVKENEKDKIVKEFLEATKGLLKVNNSCGLHVHLDMRNRNYAASFEQLYTAMPILMSMVPNSRRTNTFCKENKEKQGWRDAGGERYQVLNPTSFRKYKTLEIRVHSATTSAFKIIQWIDLLLCVVDRKFDSPSLDLADKKKLNLKPERQIRSLLSFFNKFDVSATLRNYVVRRIAKFGKSEALIVPRELIEAIPQGPNTNEEESMQEESA